MSQAELRLVGVIAMMVVGFLIGYLPQNLLAIYSFKFEPLILTILWGVTSSFLAFSSVMNPLLTMYLAADFKKGNECNNNKN